MGYYHGLCIDNSTRENTIKTSCFQVEDSIELNKKSSQYVGYTSGYVRIVKSQVPGPKFIELVSETRI